jgi:uncharacterized spore protein YtfJ
LAEDAKAGVTLGPKAMVMVSSDAITLLRLAKGCCGSNMLSSPFLRIAGRKANTCRVARNRKNTRRKIFRYDDYNVKEK